MAATTHPLASTWLDGLLALPARVLERWSDDADDVWEPFLTDQTVDA